MCVRLLMCASVHVDPEKEQLLNLIPKSYRIWKYRALFTRSDFSFFSCIISPLFVMFTLTSFVVHQTGCGVNWNMRGVWGIVILVVCAMFKEVLGRLTGLLSHMETVLYMCIECHHNKLESRIFFKSEFFC